MEAKLKLLCASHILHLCGCPAGSTDPQHSYRKPRTQAHSHDHIAFIFHLSAVLLIIPSLITHHLYLREISSNRFGANKG